MSGLDNPWYAAMNERYSPDADSKNAEICRALMVAGAFIGSAIDGVAFGKEGQTLHDAIQEVANAIDRI